jgi:hypothetical protein
VLFTEAVPEPEAEETRDDGCGRDLNPTARQDRFLGNDDDRLGSGRLVGLTAADEDPRINIARMGIRSAQRRGDLAEVNRLNQQIAEMEAGTFAPDEP